MYYSVGELKEILKDVPDDYRVVYERIEDVYFEEHGWKSETYTNEIMQNGEWQPYLDYEFINAFQAYAWPEHKILVITAHY